MGAQWLSGRVLDSRPRGHEFEPHRCLCVVSLSKNTKPSLVLVQPRKTHPFIIERLLMGRKESNKQTMGSPMLIISICWGNVSEYKGLNIHVYHDQPCTDSLSIFPYLLTHSCFYVAIFIKRNYRYLLLMR